MSFTPDSAAIVCYSADIRRLQGLPRFLIGSALEISGIEVVAGCGCDICGGVFGWVKVMGSGYLRLVSAHTFSSAFLIT